MPQAAPLVRARAAGAGERGQHSQHPPHALHACPFCRLLRVRALVQLGLASEASTVIIDLMRGARLPDPTLDTDFVVKDEEGVVLQVGVVVAGRAWALALWRRAGRAQRCRRGCDAVPHPSCSSAGAQPLGSPAPEPMPCCDKNGHNGAGSPPLLPPSFLPSPHAIRPFNPPRD